MQHTEDNREQDTETNIPTQDSTENNTEPQYTCSAHNFSTYSLDYYNEFAYIKDNDTIELYTILQDNV